MRFPSLLLLLAFLLTLPACDTTDPGLGDEPGDDQVPVPTTYTFESRFIEGASSVDIGGMVVRQLLIQDLKMAIDALAEPGAAPITAADLNALYDYQDNGLTIRTPVPAGLTPNATTYDAIATGKSLSGRKGADAVLLGSEGLIGNAEAITVDELLQAYFDQLAQNASNASKRGTVAVYTTENGVDMSQMVNKVLLGAIVYDQLSNKYLADILDRDNTAPRGDGLPDTEQEHRFDEAFGYFGAARDYTSYTDAELAGGVDAYARDTNADGVLDFTEEYNFAFARNAGKRDAGGTGVNFSAEAFDAFLRGRTAIVNGDQGELAVQRKAAAEAVEKVIAATVVHYINDTLADMAELTAEQIDGKNDADLNKHWGEMKGYTFALQFGYRGDEATGGPLAIISTDALEQLHDLMGNAPVYAAPGSSEYDAYVADLNAAKTVLQDAYDFSDANMAGW